MAEPTYKTGIGGPGFIAGANQVSGDALAQRVEDLDRTHLEALSSHPRLELAAGSSRDAGRRERFAQRTDAVDYSDWRRMLDEALDIVSIATYTPFTLKSPRLYAAGEAVRTFGGDSPSTSLIAATLPAISSFTAADGCSPNSTAASECTQSRAVVADIWPCRRRRHFGRSRRCDVPSA